MVETQSSNSHISHVFKLLLVAIMRGWVCRTSRHLLGTSGRMLFAIAKEHQHVNPGFLCDIKRSDWTTSIGHWVTAQIVVSVDTHEEFTIKNLTLQSKRATSIECVGS
jgi:hypothetical protein